MAQFSNTTLKYQLESYELETLCTDSYRTRTPLKPDLHTKKIPIDAFLSKALVSILYINPLYTCDNIDSSPFRGSSAFSQ